MVTVVNITLQLGERSTSLEAGTRARHDYKKFWYCEHNASYRRDKHRVAW
jgi:hypothetical protein